ncbi:hypothetical protein AC482_06115 [miscellaneous Crenarchaeota group-15 archaeon DG-45]|uniref:Uncharacterized protein n=1 Tax=miscellaneous Crenarchaeota group-15 archaeon DG-45 TaxID=1685127 RepID=A0A0M0BMC5_9ARCH|nr:MAG: hypothetical protein AC482_06115 [miscellaneous Crenarchaeota group-15 archaeon DG-45]
MREICDSLRRGVRPSWIWAPCSRRRRGPGTPSWWRGRGTPRRCSDWDSTAGSRPARGWASRTATSWRGSSGWAAPSSSSPTSTTRDAG